MEGAWAEAARRLSLLTSTLENWVKAARAGKLGEVGRNYRPLTEIEMKLSRIKKENTTLKMENEILKKQLRTLPGSRCPPVRGDEADAAPLPRTAPESEVRGLDQRFLYPLDQPATIRVGKGRNAVRGADKSGAPADAADLWGRESTA